MKHKLRACVLNATAETDKDPVIALHQSSTAIVAAQGVRLVSPANRIQLDGH